jgi:hypothetical protein
LLARDGYGVAEVADTVGADAALATTVLAAANSALLSAASPITSIFGRAPAWLRAIQRHRFPRAAAQDAQARALQALVSEADRAAGDIDAGRTPKLWCA